MVTALQSPKKQPRKVKIPVWCEKPRIKLTRKLNLKSLYSKEQLWKNNCENSNSYIKVYSPSSHSRNSFSTVNRKTILEGIIVLKPTKQVYWPYKGAISTLQILEPILLEWVYCCTELHVFPYFKAAVSTSLVNVVSSCRHTTPDIMQLIVGVNGV